MKLEDRRRYLAKYSEDKKKGIPFFPDAVIKDVIVGLVILLLLIALAVIFGAPLEDRADPADTEYTPRPEWYFLFLFQLLKYFPGNLEFVGVVLLPVLAFGLLFALPYLDRGPARHPANRKRTMAAIGLGVVVVFGLTVVALMEQPPPAVAGEAVDTAALFSQHCSGCHGIAVTPSEGTDLHETIVNGHGGMPAFGADLSTDEVDALVGLILSPNGMSVFNENCASCHDPTDLAASDPFALRSALEQGSGFESHIDVNVPEWSEVIARPDRTALLNFLLAPDGQRLYTINCATCHGPTLVYEGRLDSLTEQIRVGGGHLEMPQWRDVLSADDIAQLAWYVTQPSAAPAGEALFVENCVDCHGVRVPRMPNAETAFNVINDGMSHQTMPLWGDVLTDEQLTALAAYVIESGRGTGVAIGQRLFGERCASCHGDFGEGGPHPANPFNIISPISTKEYLTTRDNATLDAIITRGQSDLGMAPFGESFGGDLTAAEIGSIISFLRTWEQNPPIELPPDFSVGLVAGDGQQVYRSFCTQCHGDTGKGGSGPALDTEEFQGEMSDEELFATIDRGHQATSMIAWGDILTPIQVKELVAVVRGFSDPTEPITQSVPNYQDDIASIIQTSCAMCHGSSGGWDAATYDSVISSGNSGPAVIPGDPENSPLYQRIVGQGSLMPPGAALNTRDVEIIGRWIEAGAPRTAAEAGTTGQVLFNGVAPILASSCAVCHGSSGGWDAATYDSVISSGNSGPAVIPGDPENSPLYQRIVGQGSLMPPGTPLPDDQIEEIRFWIESGASP